MSEAIGDASDLTASGTGIYVRRLDIALTNEIPRHWCRNEPFATHLLNALSSVFPIGERFFVRSVLHHSETFADDPRLSAEVHAFAAQEGLHNREHDRHIEMLVKQGYCGVLTRNRLIDGLFRWLNKWQPVTSLAATAALEHLTATLSRVVLSDDRVVHGMDPRMRSLWQWHALEESEHKAVAYDVLMRVSSSYWLRVYVLVVSTLGLAVGTLERAIYMLWKDGELFKWKIWRDCWRALFTGGRPATSELGYQPRGVMRDIAPYYLAWYRRDFHPSQQDDSRFIAEHQQHFAAAVAGPRRGASRAAST
jgi:predicted metal-dependent hydrolase